MGKVQKIGESIDYRSIEKLKEGSMVYRSIEDDSAPSQRKQRAIAERLLQKLGEPKSWKFYLKCAYHLPEVKIWEFVELALKPNVQCSNRYFVVLANKEMKK